MRNVIRGLCLLACLCVALPLKAQDAGWELTVGALAHNHGPLASHTQDGIDLNVEGRYLTDWGWLRAIGNPALHAGATVNFQGGVSHAYGGMDWRFMLTDSWSFGTGGGFAVHNGDDYSPEFDERSMGTRFLFRFFFETSWHFSGNQRLSLFWEHISNGGMSEDNQGNDNIGIRYGYRFD